MDINTAVTMDIFMITEKTCYMICLFVYKVLKSKNNTSCTITSCTIAKIAPKQSHDISSCTQLFRFSNTDDYSQNICDVP